MANTTTKVDLVINRMSQSKYEQLKSAGQLDPNQIYMTTDGIDPVPDTRKVNDHTLEADVTLTGEDIAVSTSDPTTINDKFDDYVLLSDLEDGIEVEEIEADSLLIDGKLPSLAGHKHDTSDIIGFPSLAGQTMPANPTQNELTVAVKKIWQALGGSFV